MQLSKMIPVLLGALLVAGNAAANITSNLTCIGKQGEETVIVRVSEDSKKVQVQVRDNLISEWRYDLDDASPDQDVPGTQIYPMSIKSKFGETYIRARLAVDESKDKKSGGRFYDEDKYQLEPLEVRCEKVADIFR